MKITFSSSVPRNPEPDNMKFNKSTAFFFNKKTFKDFWSFSVFAMYLQDIQSSHFHDLPKIGSIKEQGPMIFSPFWWLILPQKQPSCSFANFSFFLFFFFINDSIKLGLTINPRETAFYKNQKKNVLFLSGRYLALWKISDKAMNNRRSYLLSIWWRLNILKEQKSCTVLPHVPQFSVLED